jgi:pyrrolidone-carboxylate peptidase
VQHALASKRAAGPARSTNSRSKAPAESQQSIRPPASEVARTATSESPALPVFLRKAEPTASTTAPTLVQRQPRGDEPTPPPENEGPPIGTQKAGVCDPTPLARADFLTQQGASKKIFGLTQFTGSTRDFPRVETKTARGGRGFNVPKTPEVMPPIISIFTKASMFDEDDAPWPGGLGCLAGTLPVKWIIAADGANLIRDGEIEHCKDITLAWQLSMARYAAAVNKVARDKTVFADDAAAEKYLEAKVGVHPNQWLNVFQCLLGRTLERDHHPAGGRGWHEPEIQPRGEKRPDPTCKFLRAIINKDSLPEVNKHPSAEIVKDCGEAKASKSAPKKTPPKQRGSTRTDVEAKVALPLFLQRCACGCGGSACGAVQVSQPDDPAEREAEYIARSITEGAENSAQPAMALPQQQAHLENGGASAVAPQNAQPGIAPPTSGGAPLPDSLREFFEPRLQADLSHVRTHADANADASARAFAARAYTAGEHIVFGAGEFHPATTRGRALLAHELVHVVQQSRGTVRRSFVQRQPATTPCNVRTPEDCATFELWLLSFRSLPTFISEDGIPLAQGGTPKRFVVLGEAPAARDPSAPAADQPAAAVGPRLADRFIDHPTDAWVRDNLPENLRLTAYQLPSDCADILVILRHVYLSAHHRTERYRDWLVGDALGRAAQSRIHGVIRDAVSANLERVVNPYLDAQGRPIRDFARLEPLLHPGDQLVWDHHGNGLTRPRTGGHSQTIMDIQYDDSGHIEMLELLQGNQPIFQTQAREIISEVNRERVAAGRRPLPASETRVGGPLEMGLRHSPGRRIEVTFFGIDRLRDIDLPPRRGSTAPPTRVWTWSDPDNTILEAAGPPRAASRPALRRIAGVRAPRLSDWLSPLRNAATDRLHGVFEAALHETRAVIDGGSAVASTDATNLGHTAGERLWNLARRAVRRLVAFGRRQGDLASGDLGERSHFEPLHRIRAMIQAMGGINPPTYHGNPAAAGPVRQTFTVIDREFDFSARGGDDISFTRTVRRGGQLVRVLITGFDPFDPNVTGPPPAGSWNPSGAAVLSMDGTQVALDGRDVAAIEGVVFPVSFAQFRAGIVERAVRQAGPNVDAIISVSLDPNLASTAPVRIEQFALGVHGEASIQPHRLFATETTPNPGLHPITPGGPALVESNIDVAGVAAETAGRERRGLPDVAQPDIGSDITLRFANHSDATRAARALGVTAPAAGDPELVLVDPAIVRAVMTSATPLGSSASSSAQIEFTAAGTRFRATLVDGPGGTFLSNEVFYRVRTEIDRTSGSAISFHVHTPGAAPIPQATATRTERRARTTALGAARNVVVTLIATLRRAVASVGRRVIAARPPRGTP